MRSTTNKQSQQLFEAALGLGKPWYVRESRFDAEARTLTISEFMLLFEALVLSLCREMPFAVVAHGKNTEICY